MSGLVVDASVAVKWVVQEPGSDAAAALEGQQLAAPTLLLAECANTLWAKTRRGELTAAEASERISALKTAPVEFVPLEDLLDEAVRLARDLEHPVYDCLYLALAVRRKTPLITADPHLVEVARHYQESAPAVLLLGESS